MPALFGVWWSQPRDEDELVQDPLAQWSCGDLVELAAQVPQNAASVALEPPQRLAHALELPGMSIAAHPCRQPGSETRVALPQAYACLSGELHQLRSRPLVEPRVGRVGDGLLHHRSVDGDLLQAPVLDGAGSAAGLDGLAQHPLNALLANALAPAGERARVDRRVVLEEGLAGEVLIVGVLHPACDHRLVREPEGMLKIKQPRYQPWRGRRTAGDGGKEPRPLPFKEVPVDEAGELHQLMTQVDQVNEPRTEKVVLLGRARAVLHQGAGNCRVLASIL